jgi:hypothetical protein
MAFGFEIRNTDGSLVVFAPDKPAAWAIYASGSVAVPASSGVAPYYGVANVSIPGIANDGNFLCVRTDPGDGGFISYGYYMVGGLGFVYEWSGHISLGNLEIRSYEYAITTIQYLVLKRGG